MKRIVIGMGLLMLCAANSTLAQSYEFKVERDRALRNQQGKLIISPEKIEYQTDHKGESRAWRYDELRQIKVESPRRIELVSYEDQKWKLGLDRVFKFKVLEGEITPAVGALLMGRAARPLVTSLLPAPEAAPAFEAPVKHLRRFGGRVGTLKIYPDHVAYESKDAPSDSRCWRYGDIRNFSQSDRFRFEIVTFEDNFGGPKAYNFQLRVELPAAAYDYVWARVYPSKLRRDENLARPGNSPTTSGKRPATVGRAGDERLDRDRDDQCAAPEPRAVRHGLAACCKFNFTPRSGVNEVKASTLHELRHATRFNIFVMEMLDLRRQP